MKYDLRKPCLGCPFRTDVEPYLAAERAEEIIEAITRRQQTFACHKHTRFDEDEEGESVNVPHSDDQHCAGALILLERMEMPNQMMRISERLGLYDRTKLHMDAPVYEDADEMLEAYGA